MRVARGRAAMLSSHLFNRSSDSRRHVDAARRAAAPDDLVIGPAIGLYQAGADDLVLELVVNVASGIRIGSLRDDRNRRQAAAHEAVEEAAAIDARMSVWDRSPCAALAGARRHRSRQLRH